MKKILIIFTGGTICMEKDSVSNAAVPALSGEEILASTPGINKIANIHCYNFGMFPGPHITPAKMFKLSKTIKERVLNENFDGIVVTHGTDTLEETAFLVDLTYDLENPVVFVGALKSSSDVGWDGTSNLLDAVYTASSDESYNRGVLVALHNEIHLASQVTKTHTHKLNAFNSRDFGSIGFLDNNKVFYYHTYVKRQFIDTKSIEPKVDLIKCAAGMDDRLIKYSVDSGAKGIVIEGTGRGNIPPTAISGIKYAIEKNVPVILVSRCYMGKVFESYGYAGSGMELINMGVIKGDNLPGQKARIKLMVALGYTKKLTILKDLFEKNYY